MRIPPEWKQERRKNTTVFRSPTSADERIEVTVVPLSESGQDRTLDSVVDGVKYQIQVDGEGAPVERQLQVSGRSAVVLTWSYTKNGTPVERQHYVLALPAVIVHVSCVRPAGSSSSGGLCDKVARSVKPAPG